MHVTAYYREQTINLLILTVYIIAKFCGLLVFLFMEGIGIHREYLRVRKKQKQGWRARTFVVGDYCFKGFRKMARTAFFYSETFDVNADPPAKMNVIMKVRINYYVYRFLSTLLARRNASSVVEFARKAVKSATHELRWNFKYVQDNGSCSV